MLQYDMDLCAHGSSPAFMGDVSRNPSPGRAMTDRPRMTCYRVIVPATLAALLAAAPLAAQGPRPVTSGMAQVQLSVTMLPTAHLQGSSQMVGWRRSGSSQEG